MKQCTKCKEYKSLVDFHKTKQTKDKYTFHCKECNKNAQKEYYKKHQKKIILKVKEWQANNKSKVTAINKNYKYSKVNATPSWLTDKHNEQIESFYWLAKLQQELDDTKYHVDHIIPIRGKEVCGMHVPWNLQIIPALDNIRKGNKIVLS